MLGSIWPRCGSISCETCWPDAALEHTHGDRRHPDDLSTSPTPRACANSSVASRGPSRNSSPRWPPCSKRPRRISSPSARSPRRQAESDLNAEGTRQVCLLSPVRPGHSHKGCYLDKSVECDRVSRLVADVIRLQPGIDRESKTIGGRLLHLSDLLQRYYSTVCDGFGLSLSAHSVLTTLRRHSPDQLTLTQINADALVTSGGMTFVVRQLEEQGLIARSPHPSDQRAVLLRLTRRGREIADQVIAAMAEADATIVAHLNQRDRGISGRLLLRLQKALESET